MKAYLSDPDVVLYHGDSLAVLRELPSESVHCIATSPPFFALRDYQTGRWEGGDPNCQHRVRDKPSVSTSTLGGGKKTVGHQAEGWRDSCPRCGAIRIDQQIGLEATPEEWAQRLVEVFREARRVLRRDGTLWVECGDGYDHGTRIDHRPARSLYEGRKGHGYWQNARITKRAGAGLKPKDLIGTPWLLAFALRADGWWLRSEIIWARPNPMPESVVDRPTKSHSTVFLLSKSPRYFYDQEAIREAYSGELEPRYGRVAAYQNRDMYGRGDGTTPTRVLDLPGPQVETLDGLDGEAPRGPDGRRVTTVKGGENSEQHRDGERWPASGANARSVWTIPTQPTSFHHFAAWPEALCRRMILAGTSERGVCPECGGPWLRETTASYDAEGRTTNGPRSVERRHESPGRDVRMIKSPSTLGWRPSCAHGAGPVPATCFDLFAGSGTTLLVARKLGRRAVGIELNSDYCALAAERLAQQSLFAEAT